LLYIPMVLLSDCLVYLMVTKQWNIMGIDCFLSYKNLLWSHGRQKETQRKRTLNRSILCIKLHAMRRIKIYLLSYWHAISS
jgi:hypothetical protein